MPKLHVCCNLYLLLWSCQSGMIRTLNNASVSDYSLNINTTATINAQLRRGAILACKQRERRGPLEEIHTSSRWLVKLHASLQMGLEQIIDLSGRRSNSGMFTSGKPSVMPTISPTAARESSMSSLFFCYRVVFVPGFGRETPAPQRSVLGGSLHTHPTESQLSLSTCTQNTYWSCAIKGLLLMSILPFCANKGILKKHHRRLLFPFLPTRPTFSGSSLDGDDGKLGQTEEENRTGTNWHPRHGTVLGTRWAVTHLRRLRTSKPVSRLKRLLFQWPFQHFPIPVWWF